MKNAFVIAVGIILCAILSYPVWAEELKFNINVESGSKATQIVGADVYAIIDGKLTEITISPEDTAFKMNSKFGALRLKGLWLTNKKAGADNTSAETEDVTEE